MSEITVGVVGLGYVGIPLAVEFAKKYKTIGFDTNEKKIEEYKKGIDVTREVGNEAINNTTIFFTTDATKLSECNRIIVAVPTPVNEDKTPDLTPVISASEIVGKNMSIQDIKDKLNETSILFDIKGLFNKNEIEKEKIEYWSL